MEHGSFTSGSKERGKKTEEQKEVAKKQSAQIYSQDQVHSQREWAFFIAEAGYSGANVSDAHLISDARVTECIVRSMAKDLSACRLLASVHHRSYNRGKIVSSVHAPVVHALHMKSGIIGRAEVERARHQHIV